MTEQKYVECDHLLSVIIGPPQRVYCSRCKTTVTADLLELLRFKDGISEADEFGRVVRYAHWRDGKAPV